MDGLCTKAQESPLANAQCLESMLVATWSAHLQPLRVGEAVELRMQCSGRRSSRGVGPDTCLVISHAHRIAVNEQEKATGAGRRNAGAGTKVAKGSFVEVWKVGERFLFGSGAAPLHAAVPRDQTIKATKTT
eukprot:s5633_g5.t2